ncbi:Conserved_hypothetical protein [Hexamita inflata]|uniref:Uncharacterized protein n=1 Tax=Hexamita inflata TaxID=28002 RepID=A0AA86NYD6_9EUKA|nr:Conserved hypothetical protein [Hexamita inflata]
MQPELKIEFFSHAIKQYVGDFFKTSFSQLVQYYDFLRSLSNKQRYGMWKNIGQYIHLDQKQCREFFHNTWSAQFFEPVTTYRPELKQLIDQFEDPKLVLAEFTRRHLNVIFNKHELQVVIQTLCKRKQVEKDKK